MCVTRMKNGMPVFPEDYMHGVEIHEIIQRVQAVKMVCKVGKIQNGSSYMTDVLTYIDSELAKVRDSRFDLDSKIRTESIPAVNPEAEWGPLTFNDVKQKKETENESKPDQ